MTTIHRLLSGTPNLRYLGLEVCSELLAFLGESCTADSIADSEIPPVFNGELKLGENLVGCLETQAFCRKLLNPEPYLPQSEKRPFSCECLHGV